MDKSYLWRFLLAALLVTTFMGEVRAGDVEERDLGAVVTAQDEISAPAKESAASQAKDGFSDGAKGIGGGFKHGALATGHGFKWLGQKMGDGVKTAGVAMGHGFKKAGSGLKYFFTGQWFGSKKDQQVQERDLQAEAGGAHEADTDWKGAEGSPSEEDLELDFDSQSPQQNNDWRGSLDQDVEVNS